MNIHAHNEAKMTVIQSATQVKEAGKNLHNSPLYSVDPHKAIVDFVAPYLDQVQMGPAKILVATYRQPEKTAGGLIKTQRFLDEDKFQGVTGLVLKLGPLTFSDDSRVKFGGFQCAVSQWVVYKPENGWAKELRGLHCRIIDDVDIIAVTSDPELFW